MAPKRQLVMDAIALRFASILTGVGGYYSDLGLNIIASRPQVVLPDGAVGRVPVEPVECPCILIRDPLDTVSRMNMKGDERHVLDVEIEVRHEGGAITDSDLRKMEQDVRTAIGVDPTWGGLAREGTVWNSCEKMLIQADKIIGGLLIRVSVTFYTSKWSET